MSTIDDTDARRRIRHQLDSTLFVEAGAGTGKTTALVGRIIELVATGTSRLRSIAAITFTEAAAGELRDRVREALERLAAGEPGDDLDDADLDAGERRARAERATEALADLDAAAISTLHGFAQRVLAEHPFEAGLPPTFEVFDEIRSTVAFDERWSEFLDRLLDDPVARSPLQRALVCGITLAHLRTVAIEFNRNWDLVADHPLPAATPGPVDAAPVLDGLGETRRLADWCTADDDRLFQHVIALQGFAGRLGQAETDLEVLQLLAQAPKIAKPTGGQAGHWPEGVEPVRRSLQATQAALDQIVLETARHALEHLLVAMATLTIEAADQRRREGSLEFHDLLVQARDLLRRDPDVARRLRTTYSHVLIDEFQDTDPIQIELAVRIVSDDPDAGTKPWDKLSVPPGRLFFVGDPKQAIYRFRRADIALFLQVRDSQVSAPMSLTRNRRSVPGIIDWVNLMFSEIIGEGDPGAQPVYEPLAAHRSSHAFGPGDTFPVAPVVLFGGAVSDQKIGEIRLTEATEIADAVDRARAEGWPVGDDGHRATLSDICVLIPTRTSLGTLERAFDQAGLPYRVESSSLVYASSEVRDLLNVLRAVDDPTNDVAIVAALRSPWFGCGDDDLLEYHSAARRWDYRRPPPDSLAADHPVAEGLQSLSALHRDRWWHDASGLIEHVLAERRAFELGLDERRPRDVWRRLRFVIDQARVFTDAYGTDLRRYLAWADLQSADDARVVEAILPETDDDAVRIMTVHASKGLEFPIVVLSGLNTEDRSRVNGVDVVWGDGGPEVRITGAIATEDYAAWAERETRMDRAEQMRLLYVAATRARDHLIVSLHHKAAVTAKSHAARLDRADGGAEALTRRLLPAPTTPTAAATGPITAGVRRAGTTFAAETVEEREHWIEQRRRRLDAAARSHTLAATSVAKLAERDLRLADPVAGADPAGVDDRDDPDDADDPDRPPWRRGRAGTAIGRAVHGVLQAVDLATGDGLAELARNQAGAEGVADRRAEIERLARAALDSEVVRAAVSSDRYWRELYVGAPVGARVLEGFVDLLVETSEGLVVVDYKTDAARGPDDVDAAVDRYRLQGASYAVALEASLGRPVDRCVFLFLQSGTAVERSIDDLDAAKDEVRTLLGVTSS